MAEYKQKTITIDTWIRARDITFHVPVASVPSVEFLEEEVTKEGANVKTVQGARFSAPIDLNAADPTFDLINKTGEVTGTMKYSRLLNALQSFYIHMAGLRDTGALPQPQVGGTIINP